ncbi:MAG: flagellar hook-associated protein FlgK [Rubellimicrobium sp.]|nr:flagellar hook-associated protein FlgK [Rubellimicrobium sp.]
MAISGAFSNALSGLNATSRMAEVVSSNVANAMTEGYAKRRVDLSVRSPTGGVQVDGIARLLDRGILQDRRLAEARMSGEEASLNALVRLEQAVGRFGTDDSIATRIVALEQALILASAEPASEIRLGQVLVRMTAVTEAFHDGERMIRTLRQEADRAIHDQVNALNTSLGRIEDLNADIARLQLGGRETTALMDQRQREIDRIAAMVPVREFQRDDGTIALVTPGGATLLDGRAVRIGFQPTPTIVPEMTLASGGLSGITLNGAPASPQDGLGKLDGGSLGAAFALRDRILVSAQADLDSLARNLVERFQSSTVDPSLGPGDAGLFTDLGLAFTPANEAGLSSRMGLNAAVDPLRGGELFRLRDGVAAMTAGPVGQSRQIDAWLDALGSPQVLSTGGSAGGAAFLANGFLSGIGLERLNAEAGLGQATARWSMLRTAELAQGVDTDEEMQMLLRIEQAYAANARVIQTLEALIRTLLEI